MILLRLLAVLLLLAAPVRAQAPAPVPADQARQALEVLKDPAQRDKLIATLEAMSKAAPAAPVQLAPDSVGAELMMAASENLKAISERLLAVVLALSDISGLVASAQGLLADPWVVGQLVSTAWRLAVFLAAGFAAAWAVRRIVLRPLAMLTARAAAAEPEPDPAITGLAEAEAGQSEPAPTTAAPMVVLRRVPGVLARLVLLLLPALAFLAASYVLFGLGLAGGPVSRFMVLGVMNGTGAFLGVIGLAHALVGPGRPSLARLSPDGAALVLRWTRRIAGIGVFGYAVTEAALLFGLPRAAHATLLRLIVLAVHVCLAIVVMQTRVPVAAAIRGRASDGGIAILRARLAAVWHLVAIFYLLALWAVWALAVPDGFTRLLRVGVLSAVVIVAAAQIRAALRRILPRWLTPPADLVARYPAIEGIVARYTGAATFLATLAVWVFGAILLLEVWRVDVMAWFAPGAAGARLLSVLGSVAVTVIAALVIWEGANLAIGAHLDRLAREHQLSRRARLMTILPMLRTVLLSSVALFAGLIVLSEIGVNIAPLLAGAGVVGIAIGFGSQKLVQDVITGLFLLLESAIHVGDVVTLGGQSGSVEALSLRTIRLRSLDGSVHLIPFSAVTTVTNMTRDYGFAVVEIPIWVDEDQDRVTQLLRDIAQEMRDDPAWREQIRDNMEIFGIDRFVDNALVIQARIRTGAAQRWGVRRELLKRIKHRFDETGIASPMTSYRALVPPGA